MPQKFEFCKGCHKWHLYDTYKDNCGRLRKKLLIKDLKKLLSGHGHAFISDKDNDTFVHTERISDGDFVHTNAFNGTLATADSSVQMTGEGIKKLYHSTKGSLCVGELTSSASDFWDLANVGKNCMHVGQNVRTTSEAKGSLVVGHSEGNTLTVGGNGCILAGYSNGGTISIDPGVVGSGIIGAAQSDGTISIDSNNLATVNPAGCSINGFSSNSSIKIDALNNGITGGCLISAVAFGGSNVFARCTGTTVLGSCSAGAELSSTGTGGLAGGLSTGSNVKISCNGQGSIAWGQNNGSDQVTKANNGGCFAFGQNVENENSFSLIIGQNGKTKSSTGMAPNTILGTGSIQIAGGVDSNSKTAAGQGISVILGTKAFADNPVGGGVADFWATTGADYAEYFEWFDGNKNNEDRDGYFVTLKGDKIVKAQTTDQVIGLTVGKFANSGIIGDIAELHWNKSNKTDSLGRLQFKISHKKPLYDYIFSKMDGPEFKIHPTVQKLLKDKDGQELISGLKSSKQLSAEIKKRLDKVAPIRIAIPNPKYKSTETYIPRSSRPEWQIVALLGKVYIRDNGQCTVGKKCDCKGGIAVPGTKWFVMERSSPNTVRIFFK